MRTLYELAGADPNRRFSPYCWRIRLALKHKGLDFEGVPWAFTEKDRIAFAKSERVPVLVDGERAMSESFDIACYLEDAYPDRPSLFGGAGGRAMARLINGYADAVVLSGLSPMIMVDIPQHLAPVDQVYFYASREKRFGMKLDALAADRDERVIAYRKSLDPLRLTLKKQLFAGGDAPNYADYALFGGFQWARCVSPFHLLEKDDPVYEWRERLLDAFDGEARRALGYPV